MDAQKEESKADGLESIAAFSTAVIAVFLSISSILNGQAGDDVLIYRGEANDAWAYFQSKSIKQNLYEINQRNLELQLKNETYSAAYKDSIRVEIETIIKKIDKYEKEKGDIKIKAEENEQISQDADAKSNWYDLAEAFYQIAIVLAAIAIIAKSRKMWVLSCILGVIAIGLTAYAFFFA
ncbi:MAG: DUF4337 domain-containing protein [Bacteroidia bacterium]|nr:DUF4337 domain-containing protein [Bacteroidia bacterium]